MPGEHADNGHRAGNAAEAAMVRLAALQDEAAEAYAAITAADAALRAIAARRVVAERVARAAAARHHRAARAAAAHTRTRPGPLAQLASRFRAGQAWRAERSALDAALAATQRPLADARQTLAQVKDEFTARVRVRADAAAALRRLTAECAAARAEIAAGSGLSARLGSAGEAGWDNGRRA